MRKTMFFKMAAGNLKKNRQVYLPFILTLTGMAAIFDIMGALAVSPALDFMLGGGFMREILLMGERIVGIFSLIFLFYTNSFLLKRRKKEFGLYHILGMEKRHVALILVLELFYTVLLGLGLGLLAGTVFYRRSFCYFAGFSMHPGFWALSSPYQPLRRRWCFSEWSFFCWPSMACARSSALRPRSF